MFLLVYNIHLMLKEGLGLLKFRFITGFSIYYILRIMFLSVFKSTNLTYQKYAKSLKLFHLWLQTF